MKGFRITRNSGRSDIPRINKIYFSPTKMFIAEKLEDKADEIKGKLLRGECYLKSNIIIHNITVKFEVSIKQYRHKEKKFCCENVQDCLNRINIFIEGDMYNLLISSKIKNDNYFLTNRNYIFEIEKANKKENIKILIQRLIIE